MTEMLGDPPRGSNRGSVKRFPSGGRLNENRNTTPKPDALDRGLREEIDTPSQSEPNHANRPLCLPPPPCDLALALLGGEPDQTRERVDEILAGGKEKWLRLPERVPVHLVYFTAWADDEGTVHFRPDIYKRDPALFDKVAGPAPERLAELGR